MSPIDSPPLPDSADKEALKEITTRLVQACPSLHDTAHEVATGLLVKYGIEGLDPDRVYFHRFRSAQSLAPSFTGWQHYAEKPYETQTLTQLVIHRFRATDQDNADLLDLYGGFYTAGPDAENFDASNEVRLHGNDVLNDFWSINFSEMYHKRLQAFWNDFSTDFRTLAKCNFLGKAVEARDNGHLKDADFRIAVEAVVGTPSWPISLQALLAEHAPEPATQVRALEIDGHVATDILKIIAPDGRQILYVPGEAEPFQVMETASDLHWWILQKMNRIEIRRDFLMHFPLVDRQQISEGISDLMNRLVNTWGRSDHQLVNRNAHAITGDAFTWLRDSARTAMYSEAELSLTSNGDLRKKLWIGYLSAGLKVFGPMAAAGWPVALPVIGASLASMGLNIDQAVNGRTSSERKNGVIGAILSGIDALFNLPFLKGSGALAESDTPLQTLEAVEPAEPQASASTEPGNEVLVPIRSTPEELPRPPASRTIARIPERYMANELLDGLKPVREPGKFLGIYRLNTDPPYAIILDNRAYYVRYFTDSQGGGFWSIIDPLHPNQLIHSLPVRLNAQGSWERITRLGLKGGGQCLAKGCIVEIDVPPAEPEAQEAEPQASGAAQAIEPPPSASAGIKRVTTPYDVDAAHQAELRNWAMELPETHLQLEIGPDGGLISPNRYDLHFAYKARALLNSARRFYRQISNASLPPRPQMPVLKDETTFSDLIRQVFEVAPGLVMSETPGRITSMRLLIEHMSELSRQGVKTLYIRRLLSDFVQTDLNAYFKTGNMPRDLEQYLSLLGTDPANRFNELQLVKTARQNGIRVQATDCAATYRKPMPSMAVDEQISVNHLTADILTLDRHINDVGKWVVLTGVENTNTFRGLAGISELEGGIGLRIEEVNPGQGERIVVDPGIEIERGPLTQLDEMLRGTVETHYADLLMRVEAPPVIRSELQLHRLLHRPGMFVFQRAEGRLSLFHRSHNGAIVQTLVDTFADGRYYIERPSWGSINRVPFDSLEELSGALRQLRMRLESRLPV